MNNLRQRIGHFKVSDTLIEHVCESGKLEDLNAVMSQCIVLRCEHDYATRSFQYTALCPAFEEVEPGTVPPSYKWEIQREETGNEEEGAPLYTYTATPVKCGEIDSTLTF